MRAAGLRNFQAQHPRILPSALPQYHPVPMGSLECGPQFRANMTGMLLVLSRAGKPLLDGERALRWPLHR